MNPPQKGLGSERDHHRKPVGDIQTEWTHQACGTDTGDGLETRETGRQTAGINWVIAQIVVVIASHNNILNRDFKMSSAWFDYQFITTLGGGFHWRHGVPADIISGEKQQRVWYKLKIYDTPQEAAYKGDR
jgi:hypothetical protein